MITRENLQDVLALISPKDKARLVFTYKEYCVIYLHTYNVGSTVSITLTDNFDRYKNVSNNGNVILEVSEVQNLLNLNKELEYHRGPTPWEIWFVEGATHYKDFGPLQYLKKDGTIKKRLKCPFEDLIYTR